MKTFAALLALCLFAPLSVFAQTKPAPVPQGGMVTKINPSPGVSQYWGSDGSSTTTYDTNLPGIKQ